MASCCMTEHDVFDPSLAVQAEPVTRSTAGFHVDIVSESRSWVSFRVSYHPLIYHPLILQGFIQPEALEDSRDGREGPENHRSV